MVNSRHTKTNKTFAIGAVIVSFFVGFHDLSATVIPIHTRLRPHNLPIPEPLPILQKFPAIYLLS